MKMYRSWLALGLLALAAGCGKSTPTEPDAYVQDFIQSTASGDVGRIWTALPPKYQSDVKALISEAAANMDAEVYDKGFALAGKLTLVLKSKKDYLLGSPMVGSMIPPPIKDQIVANWASIVEGLESVTASEIKTLEGLKKTDPGAFLASTGNKLAGIAKSAVPNAEQEMEKAKKAKVTLVKREGDTATLKIEAEGEPAKESVFKLVEGKWLPAEMVAGWDKTVADMRSDMASLKIPADKKAQLLEGIKSADAALDKLLAAPDQNAFNMELFGLMAAMGPLSGGGGPPPGAMDGPPGALSPLLPGGGLPGQGIPPGLPGGVPLGPGAGAPKLPTTTTAPTLTPPVPALPR